MSKLIIVPIETIESRYTGMWNHIMKPYADIWVYPNISFNTEIKNGEFLDINATSLFKSKQLQFICELFKNNQISNGDIFFIADIFFPGIETIRYMAELQDIKVKIYGFNHAGRADSNDFVQKLGKWSDYAEQGYHSICDGIFVGSDYHKSNITRKFDYNSNNIYPVGALWDIEYTEAIYYNSNLLNIDDTVIWPHRISKEKGIDDLIYIASRVNKEFIITNSTEKINTYSLPDNVKYINGLSKKSYYEQFTRATWYLSTAKQETFGYTIQEAILFNCNIIAPLYDNCIKEMVPRKNLYSSLGEAVDMLNSNNSYTVPYSYTLKYNNNFLKILDIMGINE
ncbi:MAG: hypothetical protein ACOVNU_05485 [Candidatus Kapaibacteriota bacterium]